MRASVCTTKHYISAYKTCKTVRSAMPHSPTAAVAAAAAAANHSAALSTDAAAPLHQPPPPHVALPRPLPRLRRPLLLVSDLDDTLIPGAHSRGAREADSRALAATLEHARETAEHPLRFVVNTGRTLPLLDEVFACPKRAPLLAARVDALVTGVGTRIYYPRPTTGSSPRGAGGTASVWVEDEAWADGLRSGGWDRAAVTAAVEGLIRRHGGGGGDQVYMQRAVEQHEFKATFLYAAALREALPADLAAALEAAGVRATIIEGAAADPAWRFVDVLPAGAGKGNATERVRARFGFAPRDTAAAGDGANDLLMLRAAARGGAAAICVGNAQPELRAWAEKAAAAEAGGNHGGEAAAARVHLASPDAPAAAGVLQGLVALGFFE